MKKPILVLDFDGVIHSYTSGWKGASNIPDEPVPGALEFIVNSLKEYQVAILSSRSHQWGGRRAMKRWLKDKYTNLALDPETTPEWLLNRIYKSAFADPWHEEVDWSISKLIREIKWPLFKPPALMTIDDRAITFNGVWPSTDEIKSFKPWNKKSI